MWLTRNTILKTLLARVLSWLYVALDLVPFTFCAYNDHINIRTMFILGDIAVCIRSSLTSSSQPRPRGGIGRSPGPIRTRTFTLDPGTLVGSHHLRGGSIEEK
jgi:hypothetical protein